MTVLGGPAELVGEGLDDFERIGRGGSSTVYRAVDLRADRPVAVKILSTTRTGETGPTPPEARAQGALSWHPNVLSLYSVGSLLDGSPYLVLELAEGGCLVDRVRANGPLGPVEVRRLGAELCAALTAAHEAGIVHCDLKPSNVLFARDGSARLADFGIARSTSVTGETMDDLVGSMVYAPPELFDGCRPAPANDVYGLGLTLWFGATARVPFAGVEETPAALIAAIRAGMISFDEVRAALGSTTAAMLQRCLSVDPARRPSLDELSAAFAPPTADDTASAPGGRAETGARRVRRPGRSGMVGLAALVVALLVTVLVAPTRTPAGRVGPAPDLCAEFRRNVEERVDAANEVSADLEQASAPREVIERLLVRYPREFARAQLPFLQMVAEELRPSTLDGLQITESDLADLSLAEVFRGLGGGKPFLFDGQSGTLEAERLPIDLREPARFASGSYAAAVRRCPDVEVDLRPSRARMNSAIYSNLADPAFMQGFFEDPRSLDVLDGGTVLLLLAMARPFASDLLSDNWNWFVDLLERHPDIRNAVLFEFPDFVLSGMSADPSIGPRLAAPDTLAELQAGIERASPAERLGIGVLYGEQLQQLGLEVK